MEAKKPRVLLDCDGVLSDFVTPVLRELGMRMGRTFMEEDITGWDIYESLGIPKEVGDAVDKGVICWPGFCASLQPYPEAISGVEALREVADITIVTAPFDSDYWARERELWLVKNFGFKRYDIIQTHSKDMVAGDFLIDDKLSTIEKWETVRRAEYKWEWPPPPRGILFKRPWNNLSGSKWRGHRVNDWALIVQTVKERV